MPPPLALKNMLKRNSKLLTVDLIPYLGSQRRRLIPALSLDTPSPVRKPTNSAGVRWVDGPLRSTQRGLGEPFEIKVYEIDDVERLQRRRGGSSKVSLLHPVPPQVPLSAPRGQCLRKGRRPRRPQVASVLVGGEGSSQHPGLCTQLLGRAAYFSTWTRGRFKDWESWWAPRAFLAPAWDTNRLLNLG